MTRLTDVINAAELNDALEQGNVRAVKHPELPLTLLNYTEQCQFKREWNDTTRACRGLIFGDSAEVIARPWPKFFNYGELGQQGVPSVPSVPSVVEVTDKLDGSLGIMYRTPDDQLALATRGSFTSEQAIRGTEMLQEHDFVWDTNITYLFEIIYPENRIVLSYDFADLVLLGGVDIRNGWTYGPNDLDWDGRRAQVFNYRDISEALAAPPRPNAEGLVIRFKESGDMLKIKQDDYVALHRIVTGTNERTIWEMLVEGKTLGQILEPLPEEMHPWVSNVAKELALEVTIRWDHAHQLYSDIMDEVPPDDRKAFALKATQHPEEAGLLFMLYDDKDITPAIWKAVRP